MKITEPLSSTSIAAIALEIADHVVFKAALPDLDEPGIKIDMGVEFIGADFAEHPFGAAVELGCGLAWR